MITKREYINIFDDGVNFAINAINEYCNTEFESLAEAITEIQTLKNAVQMKSDKREGV
jgi:hypothetical protein